MKKLLSILIILILVGFSFVSGCEKKPEEIKIGYIPHGSGLPFFVAVEKGYFKDEGLNVEFIECGYREFMDALLTGRVDVIAPTSFPSLFGIEVESSGLVKFFLTGGEEKDGDLIYGILVRKDIQATTIAELKGMKIGVTEQIARINLKLILKQVGLDPDKDVTIIQVDRSVAVTSLASKQIDAILLTQPDLTIALEKADSKLLEANPRSKYIKNPYWSGSAAVTTKFLEQNPKNIKKVLVALDKAIDFIRANPPEAKMLLPKYTPLDQDIATKTGMYFLVKTTEPVDMQTIQFLADLLVEHNILKKNIDVSKMYVSIESLK